MRTRERPNGDQIAQGLAPSRPLPILLKERPRTGCIREEPLSPPGPSLPSSQPELRGWQLKEKGDQVDCFQWEAAGLGERAKVSWSQPPRLWLPQATHSVGHPSPPSPRPSGQEGPEWALRVRREPELYLLSQGIPSPPKKIEFRKPPPGDEGGSPTLGSPSLSLVGGEAGAKAHLLQDRMGCHRRHSRPGGEKKKSQPSH